jgi:hypothetical protein
VGLGEPSSKQCVQFSKKAAREGRFFQFRLTINGHCVFQGLKAGAVAVPEVEFERPLCNCLTPAGLITPSTFTNDAVYYSVTCSADHVLDYAGTLPAWISIDTTNGRLVGAQGTFPGATKAQANSDAQSVLDAFGSAASGAGTLFCRDVSSSPTPPPIGGKWKIQDYSTAVKPFFIGPATCDTSRAIPTASPEWDGQFADGILTDPSNSNLWVVGFGATGPMITSATNPTIVPTTIGTEMALNGSKSFPGWARLVYLAGPGRWFVSIFWASTVLDAEECMFADGTSTDPSDPTGTYTIDMGCMFDGQTFDIVLV